MRHDWTRGAELLLLAALLIVIAGCGIATAKGPQPISTGSSTGSTAVAPNGLQLGFIWQTDSRALYPILGVTGSAHFGTSPVAAGGNVVMAAATSTSNGSWALLLDKDGTLQEEELAGNAVLTLTTGVAPDSSIVFSPTGVAACLLSPSAHTVMVVTGLPSKPVISALQLPSAYSVTGAAVSDLGSVLAGVSQGNTAVQIGVLSPTASYRTIATIGIWGGAAFVPSAGTAGATESAVIADRSSEQLTYITNLGTSSPTFASVTTAGLLQKAAGVGVTPDGQWAMVADSGKPQILRVSLAHGGPAPSAIACACSPQQLSPLTADGIYSISSNVSGQPTWLLDARTSTPRTFFIPALVTSSSTPSASASAQQTNGISR